MKIRKCHLLKEVKFIQIMRNIIFRNKTESLQQKTIINPMVSHIFYLNHSQRTDFPCFKGKPKTMNATDIISKLKRK